MINHPPEKIAAIVAREFYDRWDRQSARGHEPVFWGRVDVVEAVYDDYSDSFNDKELEMAVNLACKILYMPEKQARAAIAMGMM